MIISFNDKNQLSRFFLMLSNESWRSLHCPKSISSENKNSEVSHDCSKKKRFKIKNETFFKIIEPPDEITIISAFLFYILSVTL